MIGLIIPMENIRAMQTPEALARDEKMMKEFMERVDQNALRDAYRIWRARNDDKSKPL